MRSLRIILSIITVAGASAALADSPTSGLYEVTMQMESTDMPIPSRSQTMTHCLSAEDLEKGPEAFMGGNQQGNGECDVTDYQMSGGNMTMTMVCKTPGGQMTMNTTGTYTDTSYTTASEMIMNAGGTTMKMMSKGEGRRVGDC